MVLAGEEVSLTQVWRKVINNVGNLLDPVRTDVVQTAGKSGRDGTSQRANQLTPSAQPPARQPASQPAGKQSNWQQTGNSTHQKKRKLDTPPASESWKPLFSNPFLFYIIVAS